MNQRIIMQDKIVLALIYWWASQYASIFLNVLCYSLRPKNIFRFRLNIYLLINLSINYHLLECGRTKGGLENYILEWMIFWG